ncbi:MAG: class I SAM-dependent methyltransferase [Chloroflexi bacterium]|nr:class I SAM-dependent methyltransferase [Chloroflexota bacterium]
MNKYYYPEHDYGYQRAEAEGKNSWDGLHGRIVFEDFAGRAFLERSLGVLALGPTKTNVLEYGCGTGPASCLLAARGFTVHAMDLIPRAIARAKHLADERGLVIRFEVADVCTLGQATEPEYDLVVDKLLPAIRGNRRRPGQPACRRQESAQTRRLLLSCHSDV